MRKSFDPPHFNVVIVEPQSGKLVELAVREGRQNCFEAILLFLLFLRRNEPAFGTSGGNTHVRGVMEDIFGSSDPSKYAFRYRRY